MKPVCSAIAALTGATVLAVAAQAQERAEEWTQVPATERQWVESGLGPLLSPVAGNPTDGAHVTFFRFPSGGVLPTHTHDHSYVGVVVTGTMRHYLDGREADAKLLPVGSTWSMPASVEHVSECVDGAECIAVMIQDAAFDLEYVD